MFQKNGQFLSNYLSQFYSKALLQVIPHPQCYRVNRGFRLNLGKCSETIIFVSLLTTLNVSNIFGGGLVITINWLQPKTKPLIANGWVLDGNTAIW